MSKRILVVEDQEDLRAILRDFLSASGYTVIEAVDGAESVAKAASERPDLVLMDVQLPDVNGLEALGRLRADERTASIPVLAVTAQAMQGDRERFLAAGFDGYVSKPLDILELVETVKKHCTGGGR